MRWSFWAQETSRSGRQRLVIAYSNPSPILSSESGNRRKISQDFVWSGHPDSTAACLMPWIIPGTSFVRMERPRTNGCSTRLIQVLWFISGNEFWLMFNPNLPPKSFTWGLSLRSTTLCGWANVSSRACTLLLTQQNHSSTSRTSTWLSVTIKNSRNRIALQELIRSLSKQQKSKMLSKDFMPMDQSFEVTFEHAGSPLKASSDEGATQPSSTSLPPSSSTSTSRQSQHLNQQHLR